MNKKWTFFLMLISFFAVQPSFAQESKISVSHPSYLESVNDLCMVGDQLWMATSGGLVQFNTLTGAFACYNKSNAGLPTNLVNLVSAYADGQLAYATPKGIGLFKDTVSVGLLPSDNLTASMAPKYRTRMEFIGGKLYVGILNRLQIYNQTKWSVLNVLPPYMSSLDLVNDFELGPNGNVFVGRQRGVSEIIGDTVLKVVAAVRMVTDLAFSTDFLWMATPNGLMSYKDTLAGPVFPTTASAIKNDPAVIRMKKAADGKLWLLTPKGLSLYDPTNATRVTYRIDTLKIGVNPLMAIDAVGNIWLVGQKKSRIWKFDGTAWTPFCLKKGLATNQVGEFVVNGKHVWVDGKDSTLCWYDGKGSCIYDSTALSLMKHQRILYRNGKRIVFFADTAVVVDRTDTIRALIKTGYVNKMTRAAWDSIRSTYWATSLKGLEQIHDSVMTTISVKALGAATDKLFGLCLEKSGSLLISTYPTHSLALGGQLLRYNAGSLAIVYTCPNPYQYVSAVVRDSAGALWMGIMDSKARGKWYGGGVICIKGKVVKTYTVANSGLSSNSVSDISIDKNGSLWFACFDGGLARLTKSGAWTNFTSENSALENDSVEQVTVDADNNVWASTLNGGLTFLASDPVAPKVVTALEVASVENTLEVYPMPCTTEVHLKFNPSTNDARIQVFNLSGQKLSDASYTVPQGGQLTLPVQTLSKGLYLLKVSTKGATVCKRLIVQ